MKKKLWMWVVLAGFLVQGCPCPAYEWPAKVLVGNFARTLITETNGLTAVETDITVAVVTNFPTLGSTTEYYYLTLIRTSDNRKEIVKVTACDVPTKTLTVERGQDDTSALTFSRNDRVELWIVAGLMNDWVGQMTNMVEVSIAANESWVTNEVFNTTNWVHSTITNLEASVAATRTSLTNWVGSMLSEPFVWEGTVISFASTNAPAGYLECDGSSLVQTNYPALFAVISTNFGSGVTNDTFNIPDLRGEFVRGWDNGRGIDTGRDFGSWQDAAVGDHTHSGPQRVYYSSSYTDPALPNKYSGIRTTEALGITRPRNVALLFCIKY